MTETLVRQYHFNRPAFVAAVDIHEQGDLLVCGDCATDSEPIVWRYFLTDIDAFCDLCGCEMTAPRMFDTSH